MPHERPYRDPVLRRSSQTSIKSNLNIREANKSMFSVTSTNYGIGLKKKLSRYGVPVCNAPPHPNPTGVRSLFQTTACFSVHCCPPSPSLSFTEF
ncbi:hypothetical protein SKAU_G00295810 [Synaphobranchus kaupii]|uniref:Uncharacterized protein n=1 Tax=Synaphobranchus kaupii TaxID=118154 RepID=A0A9Q1IMR6_SYNKA|nr:hypothetical protein SKAU_G00295810 [Synaphobranchus kaupii]